jgi:hypothetical protein
MAAVEGNHSEAAAISGMLRETFHLPTNHVRVEAVAKLPRNARGKTNYQALAQERAQVAAAPNAAPTQVETTRR